MILFGGLTVVVAQRFRAIRRNRKVKIKKLNRCNTNTEVPIQEGGWADCSVYVIMTDRKASYIV